MNLALYLTVLLLNNLNVEIHDTPVALFQITQQEKKIMIDVSFHTKDFSKSTKISEGQLNENVIQEYMRENITFRVNSKRLPMNVTYFSNKENHIRVKGNLELVDEEIRALKIKNTCLIDVTGHENIMYINLNGTVKDYRMNRRNKVIRVRY
ncbi:MAG: DUF6702 family protein [Bacteroidota bacterium]